MCKTLDTLSILTGPAALAWDGGWGRRHCHGEGSWLRCDILDIPGISAGAQRAPGKDEGHLVKGRKVEQEFMQGAKRRERFLEQDVQQLELPIFTTLSQVSIVFIGLDSSSPHPTPLQFLNSNELMKISAFSL